MLRTWATFYIDITILMSINKQSPEYTLTYTRASLMRASLAIQGIHEKKVH